MNNQPELLETYLIALRHDPNAVPPPSLDPATAAFARQIVLTQAQTRPALDPARRARLWQTTLRQTQLEQAMTSGPNTPPTRQNGHYAHATQRGRSPARGQKHRFSGMAQAALALAACLVLMGIGALLHETFSSDSSLTEQPIYGAHNPSAPTATWQSQRAFGSARVNNFIQSRPQWTYNPACSLIHIVQPGDTLVRIASSYGIPSEFIPSLMALNDITHPNLIPAGTALCMNVLAGVHIAAAPAPAALPTQAADIVRLDLGETATASLSAQTPRRIYGVEAEEDGLLYFIIDPTNAQPYAAFSAESADSGALNFTPYSPLEIHMDLIQPITTLEAPASGASVVNIIGGDTTILNAVSDGVISWMIPAFVVQAGETYYVLLQDDPKESIAPVTLIPVQRTAVRIGYGTATAGSITMQEPLAYYTFIGTQGDVIRVEVTGADGYNTNVQLIGAESRHQWWDDDSGAGSDPELYNIALPEDGLYHLIVRASEARYGAFQIGLERQP